MQIDDDAAWAEQIGLTFRICVKEHMIEALPPLHGSTPSVEAACVLTMR